MISNRSIFDVIYIVSTFVKKDQLKGRVSSKNKEPRQLFNQMILSMFHKLNSYRILEKDFLL